ncbi:hypothetical protein [Eikenella corrodens]|nr:hypothetical protein [Eikenella corrodens]MDU1347210.1 hypothetical protein [Eikenella corrodens]
MGKLPISALLLRLPENAASTKRHNILPSRNRTFARLPSHAAVFSPLQIA